ncbi:MAG: MMPL family transporter [Sneathiella sp.]|uniref:MMPL family transporter n=1 Tax=Sneathiella sp. TaxID=1964365 RepID=UPI00300191EA
MRKTGFLIYLLALTCAVIVIVTRFSNGVPLETNILALLPTSESEDWVQQAQATQQSKGSNQLIILIGHTDFDVAREAAQILRGGLVKNKIFDDAGEEIKAAGSDNFGKELFKFRIKLLIPQDRQALKTGAAQDLVDRALAQILSPLTFVNSNVVRQDPFLLFPAYLASFKKNATKFQIRDDVLALNENGHWYVLVDGILSGSAFDQSVQENAFGAIDAAQTKINSKFDDVDILKTGAVFYSREAFQQAEREATLIGGVSLFGIILLNFLIFRSFKPLLLSLLAIASGITGGLAVALLFFGQLHLLALVFGAGLIGIAVDYAFHYFCERFQNDAPPVKKRVAAIRSGLTLGLVSSVLGFLTLSLTPFPGLQQIALFSASGLTMAYLTVLYVFPLLDRSHGFSHGKQLLRLSMVVHSFWTRADRKKSKIIVLATLLIIGAFGAAKIQIDDDVRSLQTLPAGLQSEELEIRNLAGIRNETHQLFVRGATSDDVLQLEEKLSLKLDQLVKDGAIAGYNAVSQIIPSTERQQDNQNLISKYLLPRLEQHLDDIGLSGSMPYDLTENKVILEAFPVAELPYGLQRLRLLKTSGAVVHTITLSGVKNAEPLVTLSNSNGNVVLVNQADDLSDTFGTYRYRSLIMLLVAYGVVWVFLSLRYGLLGALRVMSPSIGAVLLTPCVIALFGETFTFFNAMSLILIFAIGLDYAIFNREAVGARKSRAMLANGLSAISTILAFGLLALSDTYAIHAFGITILVGILVAYCLAPLASNNKNQQLETL